MGASVLRCSPSESIGVCQSVAAHRERDLISTSSLEIISSSSKSSLEHSRMPCCCWTPKHSMQRTWGQLTAAVTSNSSSATEKCNTWSDRLRVWHYLAGLLLHSARRIPVAYLPLKVLHFIIFPISFNLIISSLLHTTSSFHFLQWQQPPPLTIHLGVFSSVHLVEIQNTFTKLTCRVTIVLPTMSTSLLRCLQENTTGAMQVMFNRLHWCLTGSWPQEALGLTLHTRLQLGVWRKTYNPPPLDQHFSGPSSIWDSEYKWKGDGLSFCFALTRILATNILSYMGF